MIWSRSILVLIFLGVVNSATAERLLDQMPSTMMAENFSLPSITGEARTLEGFRGSFVLVNFWSTECLICRAELTTLEDLYKQLSKDHKFEIVAIHAGADVKGVTELLEISPVSFVMLMDMDLQLGHWGVPQLPTSYLVTPDGSFSYRAIGTRVWNSPYMVDFLREVMKGYKSTTSL